MTAVELFWANEGSHSLICKRSRLQSLMDIWLLILHLFWVFEKAQFIKMLISQSRNEII